MSEAFTPLKATIRYEDGDDVVFEYDPSLINGDMRTSMVTQLIKIVCEWNAESRYKTAKPVGYDIVECNPLYNREDGVIYIPADI